MASKLERVKLSEEPIVYKYEMKEKVKVKHEARKAIIDSEGKRRYVEGKEITWRSGTIAGRMRKHRAIKGIDGKTRQMFVYYYQVKLDDGQTVVHDIEEDSIEKVK